MHVFSSNTALCSPFFRLYNRKRRRKETHSRLNTYVCVCFVCTKARKVYSISRVLKSMNARLDINMFSSSFLVVIVVVMWFCVCVYTRKLKFHNDNKNGEIGLWVMCIHTHAHTWERWRGHIYIHIYLRSNLWMRVWI